jgi:hypothetical protein
VKIDYFLDDNSVSNLSTLSETGYTEKCLGERFRE